MLRESAEKAYWSTVGTVIAGQAAYNPAEIATARKAFFWAGFGRLLSIWSLLSYLMEKGLKKRLHC